MRDVYSILAERKALRLSKSGSLMINSVILLIDQRHMLRTMKANSRMLYNNFISIARRLPSLMISMVVRFGYTVVYT